MDCMESKVHVVCRSGNQLFLCTDQKSCLEMQNKNSEMQQNVHVVEGSSSDNVQIQWQDAENTRLQGNSQTTVLFFESNSLRRIFGFPFRKQT